MKTRAFLKVELMQLANDLDKEVYTVSSSVYVEPSVIHGLSAAAIIKIMDEAPFLFSADDLIDKCGIGQYSTVAKITEIFSDILGDMDTDIDVEEDM